MIKILIVGFYELKEQHLRISNVLKDIGFEVVAYPLFKNLLDTNCKVDDIHEDFDLFIKKNKPQIVLWFFMPDDVEIYTNIKSKNKNVKFVLFNEDHPMNYNLKMLDKCSIFDLIYLPCYEHIDHFKNLGSEVYFTPVCYDKEMFYPIDKKDLSTNDIKKFTCDVSLICFNLLLDPYFRHQYIPRKELIDEIATYCKKNNKVFKIFGNPDLVNYYPDEYHGEIFYHDKTKLYNLSKINIVTHEVSNSKMYITSDVMKIMGSKGLLLVDKVKGADMIVGHKQNCIVMDQQKYIKQIDTILNNYNKIKKIKEEGYKCSQTYTWEKWCHSFGNKMLELLFDPDFYKKVYKLDIPDDQLWNHYKENGLKDKKICFKVKPKHKKHFDYETYAEDFDFDKDDFIGMYVHWVNNGQDVDYLSKISGGGTLNFDAEKYSMTIADSLLIMNKLTDVGEYLTRDDALIELNNISHGLPNSHVSEVVKMYMNLVY